MQVFLVTEVTLRRSQYADIKIDSCGKLAAVNNIGDGLCIILVKLKQNAVVIKVSRKTEDSRLDVPAVGTRTIQNMIDTKASLLALEFGKIFIIDIEEVLDIANRANIAIAVTDGSEKS